MSRKNRKKTTKSVRSKTKGNKDINKRRDIVDILLSVVVFVVVLMGIVFILPQSLLPSPPASMVLNLLLNEGAGVSAYDSSGNANNADINGMGVNVSWVNAVNKTGLYFKGGNSFATIQDSASLKPVKNISVSVWINVEKFPTSGVAYIVDKSSPNSGYELNLDYGGNINWYVFTDGSYGTAGTYLPFSEYKGSWHLVTTVYNGSILKIYVDGERSTYSYASHFKTGAIVANTEPLAIGAINDAVKSAFFTGKLDNVRIWNRVLSDSEIRNMFNEEKFKLVGSYNLNEGSGNIVYDSSVFGNNGTAIENNLITNPSFEEPTSSSTTINSWTKSGTGTMAKATDKVHSGTYSLKLTPTTTAAIYTIQSSASVKLIPNTTYTLSGWIFNTLSSGSVYLDLNDIAEECSAVSILKNTWQYVECNFTTRTTSSALVRGVADSFSSGITGSVWFDDVKVSAGYGYEKGINSSAMNLKGSSYVNIPDADSLDLSQLSVEAWIKSNIPGISYTDWANLISKGNDAYRLMVSPNTDTIFFSVNNGASYHDLDSGVKLEANKWYHVVGVYNKTVMKVYVNSVLKNEAAETRNIISNDYGLSIGDNLQVPERYFNGLIDEVKVYAYALSGAEILASYTASRPKYVGYYGFSESSGDARDDSSYANNAFVSSCTSRVSGVKEKAVNFTGQSCSYAKIKNLEYLNNMSEVSYSLWIKKSTSTALGYVLNKGLASQILTIGPNGNLSSRFGWSTSDAYRVSSDRISDTNWHHVVVTYKNSIGEKPEIYLDGNKLANFDSQNVAAGSRVYDGSYNLTIGGADSGQGSMGNFNGFVDELKIYDRILSPAEVQQEYLSSVADTTPPYVAFISPLNGNTYTTSQVSVNIITSSDAQSKWWNNGTRSFVYSSPVTLNLKNGNYQFTAYANDSAGNINSSSISFSVNTAVPDTTPPYVAFISPANITYASRNVLINIINNSDAFVVGWSNGTVNGNNVYTSPVTITLADGSYNFTAFAYDLAGNLNTSQKIFTVAYNPYNINVISPQNNTYTNNKNLSFEVSSDRDISLCNISFNNFATNYSMNRVNATFFNYTSLNLNDQNYVVKFFCKYSDSSVAINSLSFNMDSTSPGIILTSPGDDSSVAIGDTEFEFNVSDSTNLKKCSLFVSNIEKASNLSIVNGAINSIGANFGLARSYLWNIRCEDFAGNIGTSDTRNISFICGSGQQKCSDDSCAVSCSGSGGGGNGGGNGGGGGGNNNNSCSDSCQSKGFECGMQTLCNQMVSCGSCSSGTCNSAGKCISSGGCTPNCQAKQCGNNGCGGSCGTCGAGKTCSSQNLCVDASSNKDSGLFWWIVSGFLGVVIILVIIVIFIITKDKKKIASQQQNLSTNNSPPSFQRFPPGLD